MRTVYLIRHGHPDFALGAHMCLGRTDTPLGALGRMQACLLGEELKSAGLTAVFTSPLLRCRQTASPLGAAKPVEALSEQDMGVWDGLDFSEISARWPELHQRRASEPLLVPPGAETLQQVQARVLPAVRRCLTESRGDIAIVAHASVIQSLLASVLEIPLAESRGLRPPYASFTRLSWDGRLSVSSPAARAQQALTPALAEKLLDAADPGAQVKAHCRAVAAEALRIADGLPLTLDRDLLCSAALLHDAARREKNHAQLGAAWLRELGYDHAAALVALHHDDPGTEIHETSLLYLADKCVQEDRRVGLEERFAASRDKCRDAEALAAHERRYQSACMLRARVNALCGRMLIE